MPIHHHRCALYHSVVPYTPRCNEAKVNKWVKINTRLPRYHIHANSLSTCIRFSAQNKTKEEMKERKNVDNNSSSTPNFSGWFFRIHVFFFGSLHSMTISLSLTLAHYVTRDAYAWNMKNCKIFDDDNEVLCHKSLGLDGDFSFVKRKAHIILRHAAKYVRIRWCHTRRSHTHSIKSSSATQEPIRLCAALRQWKIKRHHFAWLWPICLWCDIIWLQLQQRAASILIFCRRIRRTTSSSPTGMVAMMMWDASDDAYAKKISHKY